MRGAALDPTLRRLIDQRLEQLRSNFDGDLEEIVNFLVVEAGDTQREITEALGFSVLQNLVDGAWFGEPDFVPSWEWIRCHGRWFELVYILCDDGFGTILFVPNDPGTEADLHSICLQFGCPGHP